jgi:hypothetical protein
MSTGVVVRSLAVGATGLVGWIVALAVRLPTRYVAGHWNVAWVGFDVILLASVIATAWAAARRPHLAPTAALVTAVLLVCDAWFDITTASGVADTTLSLLCAVVELPVAVALFRVAHRGLPRSERVPAGERRVPEPISSGR